MGIVINLLVPGLVWATVIAGLILVVREKVEEEDLRVFMPQSQAGSPPLCCSPEDCELVDCPIYDEGR